jgi:integrative and conjugative element protein (TIGR02256 family)
VGKNNSIIWVNTKIILTLLEQFSLHFPKETGGVIMGYQNESDYFITQLIGPGPKAIHDLRSFNPDGEFHEKEIASIYNESKGRVTYLGDWHTHPTEGAYLSELDKSTLRKIANYLPARLAKPLMLILGSHPFEIKCWRYDKNFVSYFTFQKLEIGYSDGHNSTL